MRTQVTPFVRASISFPADIYRSLENLAKQKKVSLAWVVREATEKYVASQIKDSGSEAKAEIGSTRKSIRRTS
jgi:metal-responsive CopG/Arc/MetJ family transcriptional regulator